MLISINAVGPLDVGDPCLMKVEERDKIPQPVRGSKRRTLGSQMLSRCLVLPICRANVSLNGRQNAPNPKTLIRIEVPAGRKATFKMASHKWTIHITQAVYLKCVQKRPMCRDRLSLHWRG
ncbi:hypothetical protein IG631_01366 [Alternaria alternata]|nr:hypothetical protein IG631_01366 [Alternaria alternata]